MLARESLHLLHAQGLILVEEHYDTPLPRRVLHRPGRSGDR
ncbi:hypothetical protein [Streptomyces sp. AV19]|nr:hypothetical protein [Streptomyces sp. AV19]MDG4536874.1 hypothetical protein [Streptomyces sp. AV19]